jgi:hypothetical protein
MTALIFTERLDVDGFTATDCTRPRDGGRFNQEGETMRRHEVDEDWDGDGVQEDGYTEGERLLRVGDRYYLENIEEETGDYMPDLVNNPKEIDPAYAITWLIDNRYTVPQALWEAKPS